jgi:hypothetical protein
MLMTADVDRGNKAVPRFRGGTESGLGALKQFYVKVLDTLRSFVCTDRDWARVYQLLRISTEPKHNNGTVHCYWQKNMGINVINASRLFII